MITKWPLPGRQALGNAGLLLLSAVICLGLAETVVRIFVPVRDVGPSFSRYDPVLGKRLKASFSAERITPEFTMRFSTNSLGFRGPEPDAFPRRPVLFLGDSFTLGYGVSDGEEFPARVAAGLRQRHGDGAPAVVNAAVGDSGNGFWVKFLRTTAPAMQPRLVVMQLENNDFSDNLNEKLFALGHGASLRALPVPPPGAMRKLQAVIEAIPGLPNSYLVGRLRQVRFSAFGLHERVSAERRPPTEETDQLTLRIVEEAISICEARGWRMLGMLVGLPDTREAAVRDRFTRHRVPVIVIPAKNERPDLYYRIDVHPHAHGHAFTADRVLASLSAIPIASP